MVLDQASTLSAPVISRHITPGFWSLSTLYCCVARGTVGAKNQTNCDLLARTWACEIDDEGYLFASVQFNLDSEHRTGERSAR